MAERRAVRGGVEWDVDADSIPHLALYPDTAENRIMAMSDLRFGPGGRHSTHLFHARELWAEDWSRSTTSQLPALRGQAGDGTPQTQLGQISAEAPQALGEVKAISATFAPINSIAPA